MQRIPKTLTEYNPATKLSNEHNAVLQVYINRDPQHDDEGCTYGLREDLRVDLLYCD